MSNHTHFGSDVVRASEGGPQSRKGSENRRKINFLKPEEDKTSPREERDFSPSQARAIVLEGRYNSLDEARKHLRDLIHKNRTVLQDIK